MQANNCHLLSIALRVGIELSRMRGSTWASHRIGVPTPL